MPLGGGRDAIDPTSGRAKATGSEVRPRPGRARRRACPYQLLRGGRARRRDLGRRLFPSTGAAVVELLATLGRRPADIRALILTHGHFDHVGFARGLKVSLGTPIWVHGADRTLAAHPYRYRPERNRVVFTLGHGRSLPILGGMVLAGALAVRGVEADELFGDGDVLEVPGRPPRDPYPRPHSRPVCVAAARPRCAAERGRPRHPRSLHRPSGPRLVAPAATADSDLALASLGRLVDCGARIVLPGHGAAWRGGAEAAVVAARRAVVDAADPGS